MEPAAREERYHGHVRGHTRILGLRPGLALGVVFLVAIVVVAFASLAPVKTETAVLLFLFIALGVPLLTHVLLRVLCYALALIGLRIACGECGCRPLRCHDATEDEPAHYSCTGCGANPAPHRFALSWLHRVDH